MRMLVALASMAALLAACGQPVDEVVEAPVTAPDGSEASAPTAPQGPTTAPASPDAAPGVQGGSDDWREVVSAEDASLLGRLDQAWRLGRAEAEEGGFASDVEALGPLVDPMAGQAGRLQPPPGTYRCRSIKMGNNRPGGPGYLEYPFFSCSVSLMPGGDLILTKTTGSQRTRGLLYPDTERRLIFVGAQAWGMDETGFPAYGQQRERDQVGVFERIGPQRWRLVIPWPKVDSKLEILELTR